MRKCSARNVLGSLIIWHNFRVHPAFRREPHGSCQTDEHWMGRNVFRFVALFVKVFSWETISCWAWSVQNCKFISWICETRIKKTIVWLFVHPSNIIHGTHLSAMVKTLFFGVRNVVDLILTRRLKSPAALRRFLRLEQALDFLLHLMPGWCIWRWVVP